RSPESSLFTQCRGRWRLDRGFRRPTLPQNVRDVFIREHAAVAVRVPGWKKYRKEQTLRQLSLDQAGCALHQIVILFEIWIELVHDSGNRHLRLDKQIKVEWSLVSGLGESKSQLCQPIEDAAALLGLDDVGDDRFNLMLPFRGLRDAPINQGSD